MFDVGDEIAGKYRIDGVLGEGAMGKVVAATHLTLRTPMAIKLMRPEALGNRDGVERFLREARAACSLKSQHAVKVFDVDTHSSGALYIVMEHLDGIDLRTLQRRRGVLPVAEAAVYVLQACEAIGEAHANGIVHRDLKPANMFLANGVNGTPCVKVLDFGIAKVVDATGPAPASEQLTSTYMILGTPPFMSPEQIDSTRDVDGRTDIWALGVILYSFTTGQLPFDGDSMLLLFDKARHTEPRSPSDVRPDIPPEFSRIILRCLEKNPARRFQSAGELAAALLSFVPDRPHLSFPSLPMVPPAGTPDATTQVERPPATKTEQVGPTPVARLAVIDTPIAQTVSATSVTQPGPGGPGPSLQRFRTSRTGLLLGSVLTLALLLMGVTTLFGRSNRERSSESTAAGSAAAALTSTALPASPEQTLAPAALGVSSSVAATPSSSAGGVAVVPPPAPKNTAKPKPSVTPAQPPTTETPAAPPPPQTSAPAASTPARSKVNWKDRNDG